MTFVLRDDYPHRTTTFICCKGFQRGSFNLEDAPRSETPSLSATQEYIAGVGDTVKISGLLHVDI